jgi:tetratricopeptide (TPR) repeat protein
MGEVLLAYDPELDRRVALKLLRVGSRRQHDRAHERLLREAQALAKLSHPNVVAVYDAGTHDDRVFLAMESIEGGTLEQWLADNPDAPWKEVVRVLIDAGEGLAAAHEAGIVHRDFKPANVMISSDGRVRVLDFGLARRFDAASGSYSGDDEPFVLGERDPGHSGDSLTETGMVMGTPAYMAPEQFFAGEIDERTDQFALCVVLYRALFRSPPFAGKTFEELGRAVERGERAVPARSLRLPRSIRAAIERGLSVDANQRFGSLRELLEILRRGIGRDRRVKAGVGVGLVLAAVAGAWWLPTAAPDPCEAVGHDAEQMWDETSRASVAQALRSSGLSYADDTSQRVGAQLETYVGAWREARVDACRATRVRGDQSERLMDLRMSCLDDRRREFTALVGLLQVADHDLARDALDAVLRLRPLSPCADAALLLAEVPPPADAATAAAVDEIESELATVRALIYAGQFREGFPAAEAALRHAIATQYSPIISAAGILAGSNADRMGQPDRAIELLDDALWVAVASHDGAAEAEALIGLVSVVGATKGDTELALRHDRHARAVLERIGNPPGLLTQLALNRGSALLRAGEWKAAETTLAEIANRVPETSAESRTRLTALSLLVAALGTQGEHARAEAASNEAIALATQMLGPRHAVLAQLYGNRGASRSTMGETDAAIADFRESLSIYEEAFGLDHPEVGRLYNNLGYALTGAGRHQEALEPLLKGLEIKRAALGADNFAVALSANNLADVLLRLDRPAEALAYAEEALAIWDAPEHRDKPEVVFGQVTAAEALAGLGRYAEATKLAEAALTRLERTSYDAKVVGQIRFVAARVLWSAGDHARARTLARQAKVAYGDDDARGAAIAPWLDEHPLP